MLDRLFDLVDEKLSFERLNKAFFVMLAIVLVLMPIAWFVGGKDRDGLAYTQVSDGRTVEITADDALVPIDDETSHVYVNPGEHIVIDSDIKEGAIRVYVVSGPSEAFDDHVKGQTTVEVEVEPGEWTIGSRPESGTTGTVTVSVQ